MATRKDKIENPIIDSPLIIKRASNADNGNAADFNKQTKAMEKDIAAIEKIMHASEILAKKSGQQKKAKPNKKETSSKKIVAKKSGQKKEVKSKDNPSKKSKTKTEQQLKSDKETVVKKVASQKILMPGNIQKKSAELTLSLRFHTEPGQSLFITGSHPLFGNNIIEDALPMQYVDNSNWKAEISFKNIALPEEKIIYNYILKNADDSISYDWGNDKIIDFKSIDKTFIIDSWNHAGYFENVFYTEPFKNVLIRSTNNFSQSIFEKNFTHLFKVKAPLLQKNQVVCLLGNDKIFGEWNPANAVLMGKVADEDYFTLKVDLSKVTYPFVYKYGIYNVETKNFEGFENRDNRVLNNISKEVNQVIVNDGFAVFPNNTWKGAGVAIPVFSLKSNQSFGVGEFDDLKLFVDWANRTGLKLIQILPVNDTTATHTWLDSYPYAAISAFALHPMFLHLNDIVEQENKSILKEIIEEGKKLNALDKVDYEKVNTAKWNFIKRIYPSQKEKIFSSISFKTFFEENEHWLKPYAAFCFLRDKYNTADFNFWRNYKTYNQTEIYNLLNAEANKDAVSIHYFVQYHLHLQLKEATAYAHENNIVIKGDIPIGIYRYGVDAWQQQELFHMDEQAGAPPDDFAVTGQNWGFPTYNWSKMREDGFAWWKQRFQQMSYYFDAFRIDHILGFFRIWSIPISATQGIMGHFNPAIPVHISEFHQRNIWFDHGRYCNPYITENSLNELFGKRKDEVKRIFFEDNNGQYFFKNDFNTQQKIEDYFENLRDENQRDFKTALLDLLSNVILFEAENTNGQYFHFRFAMNGTTSFKQLEYITQQQLQDLYIDYFFRRQDNFWQKEAMQKLPALKRVTNMLVCGEDLGLVPACVPEVMKQLGILSLEIQRMPKDASKEFFHPADAPYLSVVTPSTHDMSTIRAWWEEDRIKTQRFYNNELGQLGDAPYFCEDWINKLIVVQHLFSPAMWSIFQLQDILGINKNIRRLIPHEERINLPSNPKNYWQYRMHLFLEDLINENNFNDELKEIIEASGR